MLNMSLVDSCFSNNPACKNYFIRWVAIGFLIYIASILFLDGRQHKSVFYFLVGLPSLFVICRFWRHFLLSDRSRVLVVLLLCYFSLSALWSNSDVSVWVAAKYGVYILCLMVAAEAVSIHFNPQFLVRGIVLVGGVAVLFYTLSILFGDASVWSLVAGRSSLSKMVGWGEDSPITSAVNLGVIALAAWWIFPDSRWSSKVLLALLIMACVILIFFTKSRGPLLALVAVIFAIAMLRKTRSDWQLIALLGVLVGGVFVFSNVGEVAFARAAAPNYRLEIWLESLQQIRESWIFGQGFGTSANIPIDTSAGIVTHSHSSFLEMVRVGGVVGGGLFIWMLWLLTRHALQQPISFFYLAWFVFGILCLATDGRLLLRGPSSEWFEFWIPLFLSYFYTCYNSNSLVDR